MVEVAVLFFEDEELLLVFPEQVDLLFQVHDDDFFLVRLDLEGGVEVG